MRANLLRLAVIFVGYGLGAWLGRALLVQPENLACFWLPSGISLGALLSGPRRRWPSVLATIFLSNMVVNDLTGTPFWVGAAFAAANVLESLVGVAVIDFALGTPLRLETLRELVGVTLLVVLGSNLVTGLVGAAVPHFAFGAPYWGAWRVWWIANGLGTLLVAPVLLSWTSAGTMGLATFLRRARVEAAAMLAVLVGLTMLVFRAPAQGAFLVPFPYATFPVLLWAALRMDVRGASLAALVLAVIAVWGTINGRGPFAAQEDTSAAKVLATQAFLAMVMFSSLILATVMAERDRAERAMQRANDELEAKILARTQELNASVASLARSNAELEQFAYVASHDLREPLRAVGGMVQLLEQRYRPSLDARAAEYLAHIVDGVGRMQVLIDDLLEFSRIGSHGRSIRQAPREVDSADVLRKVVANLAAAIQESGAVITGEGLPVLRCDPTQLGQLLQNLIANAIKFHGEELPAVHVRAERKGGEWIFSVTDNGIGIDPKHFDRIFTIFQRLHTRRAYPGSGIGLAICKKIVSMHGGRIWVESTPGMGATFYFTYPASADAAVTG